MSATATTAAANQRITLAEIEAAVEKMRGIPPAKWLLVAPDGRVWSDEDPMKLARILAGVALGIGPVTIGDGGKA